MKTSLPAIRRDASAPRAFSLVEIILAVGVVGIALLAILGLFGSMLKTNAETISQQEMVGISRSLSDFLGSTNATQGAGFTNVFGWVKNPPDPGIFSYAETNGAITTGLATQLPNVAGRGGRLYRIVPQLSPNMPFRNAAGNLIARPQPSDLPANAAAYTNAASLALQIKVYAVGSPTVPYTNLAPVFIYDTTVSR